VADLSILSGQKNRETSIQLYSYPLPRFETKVELGIVLSPFVEVQRELSSAEVSCLARAQHGCDASRSWVIALSLAD